MKIRISTQVKGSPIQIMKRFDRALFEALSPPGMRVIIHQFEGSGEGDTVRVTLIPFGISWLKQD